MEAGLPVDASVPEAPVLLLRFWSAFGTIIAGRKYREVLL